MLKGGDNMSQKREKKKHEYDFLCFCGEVSTHQLPIEHGLSGTKAKGFVKCPHCDRETYLKIYLDLK